MSKQKLLIVEDHHETAAVLQEFFSASGLEADTAQSGRQAIEKFGAVRHDLIVTDYLLPDTNGVALVEACKRIHAGVKVVYITGADIVRKNPALKLGAKARVVEKPARPAAILEVIKEMLNGS